MKTKHLSIAAILLITLVAIGCQKKSTPKPAPTITLSGVTTQALPYADSTSFSWQTTNASSVTLNNKSVQTSGTCNTSRLLADTTFDLVATGDGGTADTSFTIKVKDWTSSQYGMVSYEHWTIISQGYKTDTMTTYNMSDGSSLPAGLLAEQWYFYPDGTFSFKSTDPTFTPINTTWALLPEDTIAIYPGNRFKLYYVNKDQMILLNKGVHGIIGSDGKTENVPCTVKTIYSRQSN